jgi:hypothetical protein
MGSAPLLFLLSLGLHQVRLCDRPLPSSKGFPRFRHRRSLSPSPWAGRRPAIEVSLPSCRRARRMHHRRPSIPPSAPNFARRWGGLRPAFAYSTARFDLSRRRPEIGDLCLVQCLLFACPRSARRSLRIARVRPNVASTIAYTSSSIDAALFSAKSRTR